MKQTGQDIPTWLSKSEQYRPGSDRDGFIVRNLLALSSTLAFFRLDDGQRGRISPTAPIKLVLALGCILLVSLSRNYLFTLIVLACILARACLLRSDALARVVGGAASAAAISFLVMLPAALMGQPHSALLISTKAFVSTAIVLTVALTTPTADLTKSLRHLGVPGTVILALDLALRGVVVLGQTASEVLTALQLRSVGRNRNKQAAMGGIGGVVLLKASRSAQDTYDAMRCRGFDGTYRMGAGTRPGVGDVLWTCAFVALVLAFLALQGLV